MRKLLERDMENILEKHHSFFIEKGLSLKGRQASFHGKRVDLLFVDRFGDTLIVEIKRGRINRDHVSQILDYLGEVGKSNEERIRLMLIGSIVPVNWKNALDRQGMEYREITERDYYDFLEKNDAKMYIKYTEVNDPPEKDPLPDVTYSNSVWDKIKKYGEAQLGKQIPLLNPKTNSTFMITEISENYLKIDKLPINLSAELFLESFQHVAQNKTWLKIGASRINTKKDTLEGFLKRKYYKGSMNALSTATWVAAILVYSQDEIEFNGKSRGQAIKFKLETKKTNQYLENDTKYPWALQLMEIGEKFKEQYPKLSKMSDLPKRGSNVKIHTNKKNIHFEWYIRGRSTKKVFEIGVHIESKTNKEWNYQVLNSLKKHQNTFENIIGTSVFHGPHSNKGYPYNLYTRISIERPFSIINTELKQWALDSMKKFYDYYTPIINHL